MLERLVQYLVGHGRLVQVISEQRYIKAPRLDTDSDHPGCVLTRKSTTCAHLFHGFNLIEAGSWTQGTRSLSVAESEFYAGVKGASILLGAKSMSLILAKRLRSVFQVRTAVQPTVSWKDVGQDEFGICIFQNFGCRNVLILVRYALRNVRGEHNTADIGTTAVSAPVPRKHSKTLKMDWRDGRHPSALSAAI